MMKQVTCAIAAVAVVWPALAGADVSEANLVPLSRFAREPVVVETRSARRHEFVAWRADTPQLDEQGLMFVREIRADQAMIFAYDPPRDVAMWMKNTLIPLDMLFVDANGCVVMVKHEAKPQSLETIEADTPVALVVELKGGTAAASGIDVGDRVVRPEAHWPATEQACSRPR